MVAHKFLVVLVAVASCDAVTYNYYSGNVTTEEEMAYYSKRGATACYIDIEPCEGSENEGRRVDASCNNPDHPVRGTYFAPLPRVQPPYFTEVNQSRKAESGEELPSERIVRLHLLHEERSFSDDFTQLFTGFPIGMFLDIGSVHDVANNLFFNTGCCSRLEDNTCASLTLYSDDPIYRYTNITCMNMTMPLTHQYYGCTDDPITSPIQNATATFDLSQVYNYENGGAELVRSFEGGLLQVEVDDNGHIWPPNCEEGLVATRCPLNEGSEKRCYGKHLNALLPTNLVEMWFVRNHNFIAEKLAAVNPSWDDDKLFTVARDINIACATQILIHEWMVDAIGRENLVKHGVIGESDGFRDIYDSSYYPTITLEYTYILRYFHVPQQGIITMMEPNGTVVQDYPQMNLTFRTGYMGEEKNVDQITQGFFRTPCGKLDHGVDYEMANNGNPKIFRAEDVCALDLRKGRLFGVAPYVDYLSYCFGANIESFDDLSPYMSQEVISTMKRLYKHHRDMDLLSAAWVENKIEGGNIPQTVACILSDGIAKNIKGDRHWYERETRPNAFTSQQLAEIRKFTVASLMCNVGDSVTEVQPSAFKVISGDNPLTSCTEIPNIDYSAWADTA